MTMDLLDAVPVISDPGHLNYNGENRYARECGTWIRLTDPCEDDSGDVVGDVTSRTGSYVAKPFFYEALLQTPVTCEQDDDGEWLKKALQEANNTVLGRALVEQPIVGTDSYLRHADVKSVALTTTSDATYADSVSAGRVLWSQEVVGGGVHPLMHVPLSLAAALSRGGILLPGQDKNIWGDTVVMSAGYDTGTPRVFFTGKIEIFVSGIEGSGERVRQARMNDSVIAVNQYALVDVAPCTIVRVGS